MKLLKFCIGAFIAATISSGASAATVTFDFTGGNQGGWQSSLSYALSGVNLSVTGGTYIDGFNITGAAQVRSYSGSGLGVRSPNDNNSQIDGSGNNDAAIFSFSQAVTLNAVSFAPNTISGNDYFDQFTSNTGTPVLRDLDVLAASTYTFAAPRTALNFAIGAYFSTSAYYIRSITVSFADPTSVPLPAAGWALLAGLGSIGFIRRRRKA
ncbi:MAG: VPLPA-CTERM sorting domain-containing protein [Albidovulum sp.]